jgi:cyclophilin family peptidyl-prolyl cis-trans isomerase
MRKLLLTFVAASTVAFSFSACGDTSNTNSNANKNVNAPVQKGVKPQPDAEVAVIDTTEFGKIVIELYPNVAPKHVERFKTLIKKGFYNGVTFHRIIPESGLGIIQGGDPNSKDTDPNNDGAGQSELPDLQAEFSDIPYEAGTVGAARTNDPNTANCQFYITLKRQPAFDQRYTVFGKVIQGLNNAIVIAGAPTSSSNQERPDPPVVIKSITLEPRANYPK